MTEDAQIIPLRKRVVNGYSLLEELGRGGTAIAYRAEKDGEIYCLREIAPGRFDPKDALKAIELFDRECSVLSGLDHPQIPRLHDYFNSTDNDLTFYTVQDLIPGRCLKTKVQQEGKLPEEEVVDIALDVCGILGYLHQREVIHRDVKPSNIMNDSEKNYLIDFGNVQQGLAATVGGSTMFGTLGYAPLDVLCSMATERSDLYMLGATMLNLASGIDPSTVLDSCNRIDYKQKFRFDNPSIEVLVDQMLQFMPESRPESTEQVADYLEKIKAGKSIAKPKDNTGRIMKFLASLVPDKALSYLVKSRKDVVEEAQRDTKLLVSASRSEALQSGIDSDAQYTILNTTRTYAKGIHQLQQKAQGNEVHPQFTLRDGQRVYRPLTFRENIEARVTDYESHSGEERLRLFKHWLDSSCLIAYEANSTKFKLVLQSEDLIDIDKGFNKAFLPVDYDSLTGVELDTKEGKYNQLLTKAEILEHPAWNEAVENDKALLKTYADIVFSESSGKNMVFRTIERVTTDEGRALYVSNLNINSDANGNNDLDYNASFLLANPSK